MLPFFRIVYGKVGLQVRHTFLTIVATTILFGCVSAFLSRGVCCSIPVIKSEVCSCCMFVKCCVCGCHGRIVGKGVVPTNVFMMYVTLGCKLACTTALRSKRRCRHLLRCKGPLLTLTTTVTFLVLMQLGGDRFGPSRRTGG